MEKIFFMSSGLGRLRRGFEAHVEDLYRNFKKEGKYEVYLYKGAGTSSGNEIKVFNLHRGSFLARAIAVLIRRNPYYVQNFSFFIGLIPHLIKSEVEIVYLGEPVLCNFLTKWRRLTGKKFRIIFFTGGQTIPAFVGEEDNIHHVSPLCIDKAMQRGIPEKNQFLVPHFLNLPEQPDFIDLEKRKKIKQELNIPDEAIVILSVGAIDCFVKRMDYLVREVSQLQENIFLVILGEEEPETNTVRSLARDFFPKGNYSIKTLPRTALNNYYAIADLFVLASLREGFGIVYIEALSYGIPVIAHDYLVTRYVLKDYGYYTDMSGENNLKNKITELIKKKNPEEEKPERYKFVYRNYSWERVKAEYDRMFSLPR